MEPAKTRIRINLSTREAEWEGSETFIEKYDNLINDFLDKIKEPSLVPATPIYPQRPSDQAQTSSRSPEPNIPVGLPDSFGEYYTSFPRNITVSEKMLIAAFYVQQRSSDGLFTIKEASDLLNEQNVHISNPNAFITSLAKTGKLYKNSGKYKVSEKGIEAIEAIISTNQK